MIMAGVNPLTIPRTLTCLPITWYLNNPTCLHIFPNCAELADKAEALQKEEAAKQV
nr:91_t:CDS:2 [Entrophospora candida]CAG8664719.1 8941_t:CDS:2 [Entrophospora candida]